MKRIILTSIMLLCVFARSYAEIFNGYCGAIGDSTNVQWQIDTENNVLRITGDGPMANYSFYTADFRPTPWRPYSEYVNTIIISGTVTTIGDFAFYTCINADSVKFCESITKLGENCFLECVSLISIHLPANVDSIMHDAFHSCTGLKVVNIPDNCTYIEDYAFYGCISIKSFKIPASITELSRGVLADCDSLVSVTMPSGITKIEPFALYGCKILPAVTIPNGVISIGNNAFYGCRKLQSLYIPKSVVEIGTALCGYCHELASVVVDSENPVFDSRNNCNAVIETATNTLLAGCNVTKIPTNIDTIAEYAFSWCITIPSADINNNIKKIRKQAFEHCLSITSVTIPESLHEITYGTFYGCTGLKTVTIGSNVSSIEDYAFFDCHLSDVYCLSETPPDVSDSAFHDATSENFSDTLFVPCEYIEAYQSSKLRQYFARMEGLCSGESIVDSITTSSVQLKWLSDTLVTKYEVNVYKGETHIAEYIVDSTGNIVSSHRYAMPRLRKDTTTSSADYFVIKIDDLEAGTDYDYTITGKNNAQEVVYYEEGDFQTESLEGIFENTAEDPRRARKVLQDGQMLIIRDERTYTVMGVEME